MDHDNHSSFKCITYAQIFGPRSKVEHRTSGTEKDASKQHLPFQTPVIAGYDITALSVLISSSFFCQKKFFIRARIESAQCS